MRSRLDALVGTTLSLGDAALRAAYVASVVRAGEVSALAQALDEVCERAEQAEVAAREALLSIVDALNGEGMDDVVQRLREEAEGRSLLALERLIRHPVRLERAVAPADDKLRQDKVPFDGRGRPLTLGERKSLARRPDRDTMQRLMADPHPDVIHRLLRNPRVLEDDVVRLAARRPGRSEVLVEIARSTKWVHRPRVRMALVLNPATPAEIAARIAGLLLRPELELVAGSPHVPAAVRALCIEHLERRPPVERPGDRGVH
ncbi:MAG TPA: hypothetical protein VGL81_09240 [Polyangiaceae bacterium]